MQQRCLLLFLFIGKAPPSHTAMPRSDALDACQTAVFRDIGRLWSPRRRNCTPNGALLQHIQTARRLAWRLFNAAPPTRLADSRGIQCFRQFTKYQNSGLIWLLAVRSVAALQEFFDTESESGNAAQGQTTDTDLALKCGWKICHYTRNGAVLLGHYGLNATIWREVRFSDVFVLFCSKEIFRWNRGDCQTVQTRRRARRWRKSLRVWPSARSARFGRQKRHTEIPPREYAVDFLPKVKIELVLADDAVERAIDDCRGGAFGKKSATARFCCLSRRQSVSARANVRTRRFDGRIENKTVTYCLGCCLFIGNVM